MGAASLLVEIFCHPNEFPSLVRMKMAAKKAKAMADTADPDLAFCYDVLNRVSRSFAIVIQQLGDELRDAICVFYLVLRGLDTVEDDMAIPNEEKLPKLAAFSKYIYDKKWCMRLPAGSTTKQDYKLLMEQFFKVNASFLNLKKPYQDIIADICARMGAGMSQFLPKSAKEQVDRVQTLKEYDLYCHFVAGLVGIGLSQLFVVAGLEDKVTIGKQTEMANSMGLFLQKTNIIRDYHEDITEQPAPRMFWPKDVWGKYGQELSDFIRPGKAEEAVDCLNELIVNALQHTPHCLEYLGRLQDPAVFRFCAIPQMMAIGTLATCYGNAKVFQGVVKIRKGLAARMVMNCRDQGMPAVLACFYSFGAELRRRAARAAPSETRAAALKAIEELQADCLRRGHMPGGLLGSPLVFGASWAVAVSYSTVAFASDHVRGRLANLGAAGPADGLIARAASAALLMVAPEWDAVHRVIAVLLLIAVILLSPMS